MYTQDRTLLFNVIFIILTVTAVFFAMFRGAWVDEKVAIDCLVTQGYSDVQVLDKAWFAIPLRGGGQSDAARFHLRAVNPAGKQVDLYVFTGWLFTGATIRTM